MAKKPPTQPMVAFPPDDGDEPTNVQSDEPSTVPASPPVPTVVPPAVSNPILQKFPIFAHRQEDFGEILQANLGGSGISVFDLERIKMPAGGNPFWAITDLQGEQQAVKELEGIIIAWRDTRSYWEKSFDETGGGAPPDCSSSDAIEGQGKPGGLCCNCPKAVFGSAAKGTGQACRLVRILFFLMPGKLLPNVVFISPGSHKAIRQFFLRAVSAGIPYNGAVTRLGLRVAQSSDGIDYSQVVPLAGPRLSAEQVAFVRTFAKALQPQFSKVTVTPDDVTPPGESVR